MIKRVQFVAMLALLLPAVVAAAPRTFVSAGSGLDANPCSRVQPCRSFTAALAQTSPEGEVVALDSGGYGIITITQAVTIVSPSGVHAGITAGFLGNDGIRVNAANTDDVTIRGLSISGPGLAGIRASSFGTLVIENCVIDNFANYGINAEVAVDGANVFVRDTTVRRSGTVAGVQLITTTGTIRGWISDSRFDDGDDIGVFAAYGANIVCNRCEANHNASFGFRVFAHGGPDLFAELNCNECVAAGNQWGFFVEGQVGKLATLRLARSFVTGNGTGVEKSQTSAVWVLAGTNVIHGNGTDKVGPFDVIPPDNP